jgi:hypothetical protein
MNKGYSWKWKILMQGLWQACFPGKSSVQKKPDIPAFSL